MTTFNGKRQCYWADESYTDPGRRYQLIKVVEGESGYLPIRAYDTLDKAKSIAGKLNKEMGLTDEAVTEIRTSSMRAHIEATTNPFQFTVETEEGATFTPWTDGWAIGYKVTAPDKPDRWIFLNPSGSDTLRETNAFVYIEDGDPNEGQEKLNCFHFYTVWDGEN